MKAVNLPYKSEFDAAVRVEKGVIIMPMLKKGGTIGIFSPSYPITADSPGAAIRAEEFFNSKGYKIKKGSLWGKSSFYRSGSAKDRATEFNELLYNPEVDCLMASIGGFVSNAMLPYIDYDYFAANPKPVVGMSDTTSLLMGLYAKTGITVYYGTNFATSYARLSSYSDIAFQCFCDVINSTENYTYTIPHFYSDEVIDWDKPIMSEKQIPNKLLTLIGGKSTGRLIGGNLNTLTSVWGSPYMPEIQEGDILFLENTEEGADYTERYITWLKLCGVFERLGGLIIGKHRQFDDYGTKMKSYEILLDIIDKANFPILAEFDCGHCVPMLTLPIGMKVELDSDAQTLKIIH